MRRSSTLAFLSELSISSGFFRDYTNQQTNKQTNKEGMYSGEFHTCVLVARRGLPTEVSRVCRICPRARLTPGRYCCRPICRARFSVRVCVRKFRRVRVMVPEGSTMVAEGEGGSSSCLSRL